MAFPWRLLLFLLCVALPLWGDPVAAEVRTRGFRLSGHKGQRQRFSASSNERCFVSRAGRWCTGEAATKERFAFAASGPAEGQLPPEEHCAANRGTASSRPVRSHRVLSQNDASRTGQSCLRANVSQDGTFVGTDCDMSAEEQNGILDSASRKWLVTTEAMRRLGGDLQPLLDCTEPEDVVLFDVEDVIRPKDRLTLHSGISLGTLQPTDGGQKRKTTFHCGAARGVFHSSGQNVSLSNFVFSNCSMNAGRGAVIDVGRCSAQEDVVVKLRDVIFEENSFLSGTSAIFADYCGGLDLKHVDFVDNECDQTCLATVSAESRLRRVSFRRNSFVGEARELPAILWVRRGAAVEMQDVTAIRNALAVVHVDGGRLNITAGSFAGNSDASVLFLENAVRVAIEDSVFDNNTAIGMGGGAISARSVRRLWISNCSFSSNTAKAGGSIEARSTDVDVRDCAFETDEAWTDGGSISIAAGSLHMENCQIKGSKALTSGGALYAHSSTGTVDQCRFANNTAPRGGAIELLAAPFDVSSTKLLWNKATQSTGGAVDADDGSQLKLTDTDFKLNSARTSGGAVQSSASNISAKALTLAHNRASVVGGAVHLREGSSLSLRNSTFRQNRALFGGCLTATGSRATAESTFFLKCKGAHGAAALIEETSDVVFNGTTFWKNYANSSGGGIRCSASNLTGINVKFLSNSALRIGAGVLLVDSAESILEGCRLRRNGCEQDGGGLVAKSNSQVSLKRSEVARNYARRRGGGVFVQDANLTVHHCQFGGNNATYGGSISAGAGRVSVHSSTFEKDVAKQGAAVYAGRHSGLRLKNVSVSGGKALGSGGSGGGINLEDSTLWALQVEGTGNVAEKGGALYANGDSVVKCRDCAFENNAARSARTGYGGAVALISDRPRKLVYQFLRSTFAENNATRGGAIYFESNNNGEDCRRADASCTFVALMATRFTENRATVGGGVFASDPTTFRYKCRKTSPSYLFLSNSDLATFHVLDSKNSRCPDWRQNRAENFGDFVASYPRKVRAFYRFKQEPYLEWNDTTLDLPPLKSGDPLPDIRLELLDAFDQGPDYGTGNQSIAARLWPVQELFAGSVTATFVAGVASFSGFVVHGASGWYDVRVNFTEPVLPTLHMNVTIRPCVFGERLQANANLCVKCSESEYNFDPVHSDCRPCPPHGNCVATYLRPELGYWHWTPCSTEIQQCLSWTACDFEDREDSMYNATAPFDAEDGCSFGKEFLEVTYNGAQCREGHQGHLCGSCKAGYAQTPILDCKPCLFGRIGAGCLLLLGFSVTVAMGGLAIYGSLPPRMLESKDVHRRLLTGEALEYTAVEMSEIANRSDDDDATELDLDNDANERGLMEDACSHAAQGQQATEAKRKLEEIFKVRVDVGFGPESGVQIGVNFLQVISVAVSFNTKWSQWTRSLISSANYVGGLMSDSAAFSAECLVQHSHSYRPSVLRVVVSLAVPLGAVFFYVVFWLVRRWRRRQSWSHALKRCAVSTLALVYLTYIPVTQTALKILYCVRVHDAGLRRWAMDTDLTCFEGTHARLAALLGWPTVLLFSVGFPLGVAFVLRSVKSDDAAQAPSLEVCGFLYRAYEPSLAYWEALVLLRKGLLTGVGVFGYPLGPDVQGILAVTVLTIVLYVHTVCRPFRMEGLNGYEGASLLVCQLTFASGLFFNRPEVSATWRVVLTIVSVALILGLSGFLFAEFLRAAAMYSRLLFELSGVLQARAWGNVRSVKSLLSGHLSPLPSREPRS